MIFIRGIRRLPGSTRKPEKSWSGGWLTTGGSRQFLRLLAARGPRSNGGHLPGAMVRAFVGSLRARTLGGRSRIDSRGGGAQAEDGPPRRPSFAGVAVHGPPPAHLGAHTARARPVAVGRSAAPRLGRAATPGFAASAGPGRPQIQELTRYVQQEARHSPLPFILFSITYDSQILQPFCFENDTKWRGCMGSTTLHGHRLAQRPRRVAALRSLLPGLTAWCTGSGRRRRR